MSHTTITKENIIKPLVYINEQHEKLLIAETAQIKRWQFIKNHVEYIYDENIDLQIKVFFIRALPVNERIFQLFIVEGNYNLIACNSGGWLLLNTDKKSSQYWIPRHPIARTVNTNDQILTEKTANIHQLNVSSSSFSITLTQEADETLDFVCLEISVENLWLVDELQSLSPVETQAVFLWGSHSCIKKLSDFYHHLIHGAIYDLRYSWPNNKKCFSENEAHALYSVFSGLEKTTGKSIYRFLQLQIVLSVIQRQAQDGGWYHGMWTGSTECHYRLHTSALHLLMDEYQRTPCPSIEESLRKGVAFLSKTTDTLDCGTWFLHDSLELTEEAMNKGPFNWIPNKTLGKSASNMLVLNTHLDSTIAINRYQLITGDNQYSDLVKSALQSTQAILSLKTAEWLYKPLFWAIGLTMLPTETASKLPAYIRAIKRISWQYLIKKLPDIKAQFPRIVMPNGYIDRELSLRTWAIDYQTINLMDLARYAYSFPNAFDEKILEKAFEFTQTSGLIKRYRELTPGKRYSVGFWAEALYYRCLSKPDIKYRLWLAEAMHECHDLNFGIPPSLLGTNGEAIHYDKTVATLHTNNQELLIANLSYDQHLEYLILNTSDTPINVNWTKQPNKNIKWFDSGIYLIQEKKLTITPKSWIIGKGVNV